MQHRRQFLFSMLVAGLASGCGRVTQRVVPTPPAGSTPELDAWRGQIQSMLTDALDTLRTFDVFSAYRIANTPTSSLRLPSELTWDPPAGKAWDAATRVSRGLHGRADVLFHTVTTASIDATFWRTQRDLADVTHDLADLGDALRAYRDRIDRAPPGDASGALGLLDAAWGKWETTSARLGVSRSEAIIAE